MNYLLTDLLSALTDLFVSTDFVSMQEGVAAQPSYVFGPNEMSNYLTSNNIWMMICTALVLIMHLGFASVETGFTQSKNTVNVLFKNVLTPLIGLVLYFFWGFNTMYPASWISEGWFACGGMADATGTDPYTYTNGNYPYWTDFLFQGMFAATCATIVSGAVAERVKIGSYLIFTFVLVGFIYPILGSWIWGTGGWAKAANFHDFAGSTVVHSIGGWAALAGIIVIGPRIGKYVDGKVNDFPGASVPLAVIGVFLLWFGWFGFNGGSVLNAKPEAVSLVLVTTSLGACAGGLFGVITGSIMFKRLDLGMALNGILAGLVAITAGADIITPVSSLIIGSVAGVLVVFAAVGLDMLKIDDCVGAVPVHLVNGIWGTLAAGIFSTDANYTFMGQLIPVLVVGVTAFGLSFIAWYILKLTNGVRVKEENELKGLDSHEHGIRGYTILVP
jgi:ammonium transporter, Amt family